MKLTYYKGPVPNFGDELNPYVWDKVLPRGFLDEDDGELLVGIGSILEDVYPADSKKIVMGAGYGGYNALPDVHDGSWDVVFVRGPRTASILGLPPDKALCDSAILLRTVTLPDPEPDGGIGFMPHFESMERGRWDAACKLAGIRLIDPRQPVEMVLAQLQGTSMLITEAMHGAIVADALRIPWVAAWPTNPRHHAKWSDWSEAIGIELRPHALRPSSIFEAYVGSTGGNGYYRGRAIRWSRSPLLAPVTAVLTYLAADSLRRLAKQEPQLSRDNAISEMTERALSAVQGYVAARDPNPWPAPAREARSVVAEP